MFVMNLLLALAWGALAGKVTLVNFSFGFALGYLLLWLVRGRGASPTYFLRVRRVLGGLLYFLWELLIANLRVAYHVLAPLNRMHPGIVAVPIELATDVEIALLANVITLTPGTLSIDVSTDRRTLYVHALNVDDPAAFRRETKDGFERLVREVCEG